MNNRLFSLTLFATMALSITLPTNASENASENASDDFPIAGTTPWQRPAGAPVIEWVEERDQAWFEEALTGVTRPIPPSLHFLENQGEWYTPFTRKGMLPPYDIRGWHE